MRLHRFHIAERIGARSEITLKSAELAHQLRRVFRLKRGDKTALFDSTGFDYVSRIIDFDDRSVTFAIEGSERSRFMPTRAVRLFAAVVKKDTFEWIVEKATELGASEIVPVMAERSEKKSLNIKRLEKIAVEASEQCGRGDVPHIEEAANLKDILESFNRLKHGEKHTVAFHTEGEVLSAKEADSTALLPEISVFIGPEGGWTADEIERFHGRGIAVRKLGAQILRAETAVVAALSQVVFRQF